LVKKIDVGVIGLGVGEQHLIGYLNSKYVDNVHIYDFDIKKLKSIEIKYKNERVKICHNEDEIINNTGVTAISIASYDHFHFRQIIKSIKNKKHIFCEKPICLNYYQLKKIENLLKKKKIVMTTNTILRLSPRFIDLKKKIEKNYFGKIFYIEMDYNYGRLKKITNGWRGKIKNFSVVLSGGIHMIDLLQWFTEDLPIKIKSFSNSICTENSNVSVKDFNVSILKFQSSLVAKISSNFGCIYPHYHRVIIYGTKGTFEQSFNNDLIIKKNGNNFNTLNVHSPYPAVKKYGLIENFLRAIIFGEKLIIDKVQMIQTMKICLDMVKR